MKLDLNLYGQDDNGTAADIAADALTPSKVDGGRIGSSRASLGGGNDTSVSNGEVRVASKGSGASAPKSKGN